MPLTMPEGMADRARALASNRPALFLGFAIFSLALRISTFGHPNIDSDEAYYFLVGQAMHEGALPYVDLWDRKPFGLFALFYLFAAFGSSVLAYQIPAWLFVAGTSWVICELGTLILSRRAGVWAGLIYPCMLPLLFGWGGQAPVFYNLLVAGDAYLILRSLPVLRAGKVPPASFAAMALGGLAITIKPTAAFEAAYFGLVGLILLARAGARGPRMIEVGAMWIVLGVAPTAVIAAAYALGGHLPQLWQATVMSNFAKQPAHALTLFARSRDIYFRIAPLLLAAILGAILTWRDRRGEVRQRFLHGWLATALLGFLAVPNLYPHYALPLLFPLSVAAGLFFARGWIGTVAVVLVAGYAAWNINFFARRYTRQAQAQVGSMARTIERHGGERGLLVFDGPVLLYRMVGQRPLSPLALPLHLNYAVERDVSHLRTNAEVARVLALRPGAVTMPLYPRNIPPNVTAFNMVLGYVRDRCRLLDVENSSEMFRSDPILVYGDCR